MDNVLSQHMNTYAFRRSWIISSMVMPLWFLVERLQVDFADASGMVRAGARVACAAWKRSLSPRRAFFIYRGQDRDQLVLGSGLIGSISASVADRRPPRCLCCGSASRAIS